MAKDVEYWNGIPVVRAQPVLSDLQRWQAQRAKAAQQAQSPTWQSGSQPSSLQRTASAPASPVMSR